MYICVCHAVTEDDVRGHLTAGACSAKAVRAACGMRPGCGACVTRIRALLAETSAMTAATAGTEHAVPDIAERATAA
jgi:bacterioferritin-associated ferredoxin